MYRRDGGEPLESISSPRPLITNYVKYNIFIEKNRMMNHPKNQYGQPVTHLQGIP